MDPGEISSMMRSKDDILLGSSSPNVNSTLPQRSSLDMMGSFTQEFSYSQGNKFQGIHVYLMVGVGFYARMPISIEARNCYAAV